MIRRLTDRGVVAVLDPRLVTARYGSFLQASMPDMWLTTDREVAIGALRRLPVRAVGARRPEVDVEPSLAAATIASGRVALMEHTYDFDLAVIGSGPGGQKAAIMAAKLGHRVCVVDSKAMVGGVCVNTGTIPSKTLREAVLYLTGMQLREMYGASYRVKDEITISDLLARLQHVIGRETEVIRSQLLRNHIELIPGMASFLDPHTLSVDIEGSAGRTAP